MYIDCFCIEFRELTFSTGWSGFSQHLVRISTFSMLSDLQILPLPLGLAVTNVLTCSLLEQIRQSLLHSSLLYPLRSPRFPTYHGSLRLYFIANAASQPIAGRFIDVFGRRSGLIVCNIVFGIETLLCGLASSEWAIILGRVVAGLGGGGIYAISTIVGSDLVPLRKRGIFQGLSTIPVGVGTGLGGLFGGWMNDNWGWKWAFLIQVP